MHWSRRPVTRSGDTTLGYIFVNTSNLGAIGQMVKTQPGAPMPYRNISAYTRWADQNGYPCQQPPWGELSAVDSSHGDVIWRVPLGSYEELEAQGIRNTGTPNVGGTIATAGGLVFVAATNDKRFRAFDSRTGRELWVTKLDATGNATPITYQGRDGRQYVVIAAGGGGHLSRSGDAGDSVIAFALPDPQR